MTNGQKIIEIAEKEIGYVEEKGNDTKFGKWFGFNKVPWCAIFVSWCYHFAGFPLRRMGWTRGFAGCENAVALFRQRNEVTQSPQAGDIVFFDWNNDQRYDHVGIFVKWVVVGRTFETIEGNTSPRNQSNGGQVMLRTRSVNAGTLFVHPKVLD